MVEIFYVIILYPRIAKVALLLRFIHIFQPNQQRQLITALLTRSVSNIKTNPEPTRKSYKCIKGIVQRFK